MSVQVTGPLTVYTARRIVTMEPSLPTATAVAVAGDRIVSVGTLESLQPWIDAVGGSVDRRLDHAVLLPGLVDPHVHPALPAMLTQMPFVAPDDWSLPTGEFPAARTPEAFRARLRELLGAHADAAEPFLVWGYHQLYHGSLERAELDVLVPDQPAVVWHRSFHELIVNTAALRSLGLDQHRTGPGVDIERGRFYEVGLAHALTALRPLLFRPDRFGNGLRNFLTMVHEGGVTTAMDMGAGTSGGPEREITMLADAIAAADAPCRVLVTPWVPYFVGRGLSPEQTVAACDELTALSTDRVIVDRHAKLMIDGAFYGGLMQLDFPGYLDGHHGEWLTPPETNRRYARALWDAGYQLHAHTNGDLGAAFFLEMLAELLDARPRFDHRTTLEHFGYATEDQVRRLGALGGVVSAQPWYVHVLGDAFRSMWLGSDRAESMVRLGACERHRVPFALHSDCPMAPLAPLRLAWAAATRTMTDGGVLCPPERVSLDAALRAVTTDAAWVLRREHEIGSIRAGKRADFTVVHADPYEVGADALRELTILGTVFGGAVRPVRGRI